MRASSPCPRVQPDASSRRLPELHSERRHDQKYGGDPEECSSGSGRTLRGNVRNELNRGASLPAPEPSAVVGPGNQPSPPTTNPQRRQPWKAGSEPKTSVADRSSCLDYQAIAECRAP